MKFSIKDFFSNWSHLKTSFFLCSEYFDYHITSQFTLVPTLYCKLNFLCAIKIYKTAPQNTCFPAHASPKLRTHNSFECNSSVESLILVVIFTLYITAQKLKFSIKNFFSKCDQIYEKVSKKNCRFGHIY